MCATELQNVPSASNPPAFGMVLFYAIYYYSVLNSVSTIKNSRLIIAMDVKYLFLITFTWPYCV